MPLPLDADLLDAEIVLGPDLEAEASRYRARPSGGAGLSQANEGASSSRPVIDRTNGSLPARPNLSCQRNSILREPSIRRRRAGDRRPLRLPRLPSISAALQLAAGRGGEGGLAALDERDRPRRARLSADFRAGPDIRASVTAATTAVSSGRNVGSIRTRCSESPILTSSQPGSICGGSSNS